MSALDRLRTDCTCCDGVEFETPVARFNRIGLEAIAYRIGTHGTFFDSMSAGIAARPMLAALTTRRRDDWTVALLDAWATALDVLSFYQERIANEGFLRTATERRSMVELARLVGYRPRPGVSASTHLAFRVAAGIAAPPEPVRPRAVAVPDSVVVPAGTRAQSTPESDELPQPFETADRLEARAAWNELRPRRTEPQLFDRLSRRFFLDGTATGLEKGDMVLVSAPESADPENPGALHHLPLKVALVETDDARGWTEIALEPEPETEGVKRYTYADFLSGFAFASVTTLAGLASGGALSKNLPALSKHLQAVSKTRKVSGLQAKSLEGMLGLETGGFGKLAAGAKADPAPPAEAGLFALRARANLFGHNAARWKSLPEFWRFVEGENGGGLVFEKVVPDKVVGPQVTPAFPRDWDKSPPRADQDSRARGYHETYGGDGPMLLLERELPEVLAGSWLVLEGGGEDAPTAVYRVGEAAHLARADFGLSGKSTRLTLEAVDGDAASVDADFTFRDTVVHTASERLGLARVPFDDDVGGRRVDLDHALEAQLEPGRRVAVTGERSDLEGEGIVASEIAVIEETETIAGFTRITFVAELDHTYRRETVTMNANVVAATHGESRHEILGNGDAATPFQRFVLGGAPLTHLAAPVPSGAESTLELRVRDVAWHEAPRLFGLGPNDRRYVLDTQDDGATAVRFGDGSRGARLPSGQGNVEARYRVGTGRRGNIGAGRISLLATRPLGVDEVINPVPARGGADPEGRDALRGNLPLAVRTLDRIVSLEDFEDFARASSGIVKAHAGRVWDGERWVVHVSLAAADGAVVDPDRLALLRAAMDASREPFTPLVLGSYRPRFFDIEARLLIHPDHREETVAAAVENALRDAFSFDARDLGQRVAASDVIAVIHGVPGIEAVDLERFRRQDSGSSAPDVARHLDALPAGLVTAGSVTAGAELVGTELLLLAPGPVPLVALRALDADAGAGEGSP